MFIFSSTIVLLSFEGNLKFSDIVVFITATPKTKKKLLYGIAIISLKNIVLVHYYAVFFLLS